MLEDVLMACPFCKKEHPENLEQALEALERGPHLVREALAGASQGELMAAEPKPGGWTPAQVAIHLMDTEVIQSVRVRKLLAEEDPLLPAFDQNAWTAALSRGRDLSDVLRTFELLRKQNVELVRGAGAAGADRAGRHPEYGRLTLRELFVHLSTHDAKHAQQIRRMRAAPRS
jgi:hypothetical protein